MIRHTPASKQLIEFFPDERAQDVIAGFAPIGSEIDIWPLLHHLQAGGRQIVLPVVMARDSSLSFRVWTPGCEMATDRYGVPYPAAGKTVVPQFILVPLLAFTLRGERLGYGGGYYDRTLAALRAQSEIFACGVAYAGQETQTLPTDDHDERLDGILTEQGFRTFI